MTRTGTISISLVFIGMFTLSGCRQSNSVSGTVTYNGEPVKIGSVTFSSKDGSTPGFGAQVVDGKYKAEKVYLGEHVAYVRGLTEAPPLTREQFAEIREQSDNRYGLPVDYIPEDAEGNNKTFDIEGGAQTIDFKITGPPRPQ